MSWQEATFSTFGTGPDSFVTFPKIDSALGWGFLGLFAPGLHLVGLGAFIGRNGLSLAVLTRYCYSCGFYDSVGALYKLSTCLLIQRMVVV